MLIKKSNYYFSSFFLVAQSRVNFDSIVAADEGVLFFSGDDDDDERLTRVGSGPADATLTWMRLMLICLGRTDADATRLFVNGMFKLLQGVADRWGDYFEKTVRSTLSCYFVVCNFSTFRGKCIF